MSNSLFNLGNRESMIHRIAVLDETFKSQEDWSEREHEEYLMERAKLLQRVRGTD